MAKWEEIKEHLEPIGKHFYTSTPYDDIQLSIAISLKRIADVMTRPPIVAVNSQISEEDFQEAMRQTHYLVNKP